MSYFTIGIPARNEALIIEKLLQLLSTVENVKNILVCVNNSIDETEEIVKRKCNNQIKLLNSTPGKGNALCQIIYNCETEFLIMMDADCETTTSDLERLMFDLKKNTIVAANVKYDLTNIDFFSKKLMYEIPDFRKFKIETGFGKPYNLIGCLYGINKLVLDEINNKQNFINLLPNIINEDLFISRIFQNANHTIFLSDAIVVQKAVSANKMYRKIKRILAGNYQLNALGLVEKRNEKNNIKWVSSSFYKLYFTNFSYLISYFFRGLFLFLLYKIAALDLLIHKKDYTRGWKKIN